MEKSCSCEFDCVITSWKDLNEVNLIITSHKQHYQLPILLYFY